LGAPVSVESLSVVIPAYNEAERLPPSLEKLVAYAVRQPRRLDVVLVDDGSDDETSRVAGQVLEGRLPLTVLVNKPNRGKGYSVRRGLLAAQGECVLFADADFSTPIEEADRLLEAIEGGADVAIGSRGMRQSEVQVHQPWWREGAGRLFGLVTRAIVLPGIHDSQCGFKCFRREVAQAVLPHQTLDGWAFDVELLLVARRLGYTVTEVPVHWVNDPGSKVHMLTDGPRMVLDMLRTRWRHRGLGPDVTT
jgi:dolichyl-phosphate beta-glucosyltransferase